MTRARLRRRRVAPAEFHLRRHLVRPARRVSDRASSDDLSGRPQGRVHREGHRARNAHAHPILQQAPDGLRRPEHVERTRSARCRAGSGSCPSNGLPATGALLSPLPSGASPGFTGFVSSMTQTADDRLLCAGVRDDLHHEVAPIALERVAARVRGVASAARVVTPAVVREAAEEGGQVVGIDGGERRELDLLVRRARREAPRRVELVVDIEPSREDRRRIRGERSAGDACDRSDCCEREQERAAQATGDGHGTKVNRARIERCELRHAGATAGRAPT